MPPATLSTLVLTDGTTTATLTDTTKYGLLAGGWSPQIATRRTSVLGGRPYTSVVEEIRLDVYGATTADAIANLATILRLLDQAHRWNMGESFSPVTLQYQPQGSTLAAAVSSLVYGFENDRPPVTLPATYNDRLMVYEINDVVIRFVRDGAWYGAEEQIIIGMGSHPAVGSGTFTGFASHLSPVKVGLGVLPEQTDLAAYDTGFLLIADRAARLELVEAEGLITGAGPFNDFTTTADAARKPSGTGVLVYTPTGTSEQNTELDGISLDEGRRVGIVAALRNSHATTTFQVRVEISGAGERNLATTRPYLVDTSTTDPRIVLLGVVLCEEDYAGLRLYVTASAAAGTLVIDYLALINLDNPTSRILAIGPLHVTKQIQIGEESYLIVDPRALTDPSPSIWQEGDTNPTMQYAVPEWWRGDAFLLSLGTTIAAMYCGRNLTGGYWRAWNTTTNQSIDADFYMTRRICYLAPT